MTNLLENTKNNSKNLKKMQIIVFKIEIDTKNFIAKLLNKKLEKIVKTISKILIKKLVIFLNIQSLIRFLFLLLNNTSKKHIYAKVLELCK